MFEFRFLVQNGAVCHIRIEQPRETQDGFVTDVRFFFNSRIFRFRIQKSILKNRSWN